MYRLDVLRSPHTRWGTASILIVVLSTRPSLAAVSGSSWISQLPWWAWLTVFAVGALSAWYFSHGERLRRAVGVTWSEWRWVEEDVLKWMWSVERRFGKDGLEALRRLHRTLLYSSAFSETIRALDRIQDEITSAADLTRAELLLEALERRREQLQEPKEEWIETVEYNTLGGGSTSVNEFTTSRLVRSGPDLYKWDGVTRAVDRLKKSSLH